MQRRPVGLDLRNCNRKLDISTAPTKARSREPAYSQALILNKIDRQRVKSRESASQTAMVYGVWSWDVEGGREEEDKSGQDLLKSSVLNLEWKSCEEIARGTYLWCINASW